ncbi:hypothetical protein ACFLXT_04940, partial [Chloroflexota bacterium]
EGNYEANGEEDLGPIHITGNLILDGQDEVTIVGTVYVDGEITTKAQGKIIGDHGHLIVEQGDINLHGGNTTIEVENIPYIIALNGNIKAAGSRDIYAVLYAPHGILNWAAGNGDLIGAMIGQEVTVSNKVVYYPFGDE